MGYIEFLLGNFVDWVGKGVKNLNGNKIYICGAIVDGTDTLYITKTEFSMRAIHVSIVDANCIYKDDNGEEMLVYEAGGDEHDEYNKYISLPNWECDIFEQEL